MVAFASPAIQDNQPAGAFNQKSVERIYQEVRHELVMLPYYGVFDNLSYKVDNDGTVTLIGQVARPTLKSDAENVVKKIEGVDKVVNNIEVLPTSLTMTASAKLPIAPSMATAFSANTRCAPSRPFTSSSRMAT